MHGHTNYYQAEEFIPWDSELYQITTPAATLAHSRMKTDSGSKTASTSHLCQHCMGSIKGSQPIERKIRHRQIHPGHTQYERRSRHKRACHCMSIQVLGQRRKHPDPHSSGTAIAHSLSLSSFFNSSYLPFFTVALALSGSDKGQKEPQTTEIAPQIYSISSISATFPCRKVWLTLKSIRCWNFGFWKTTFW